MLISIVAAVVIFAILIIVHEAGHFIVAKKVGVRVLRFSVGYPPRIWGVRRGETDYALGATPLGGYVRMLGDEISEEPSESTLESYLNEIKLDLLTAAKHTGWIRQSGKSGDDAITAIAEACFPPDNSGRAIMAAGGADLDSQGTVVGRCSTSAKAIVGRELTAEETFLLREISSGNTPGFTIERLSKDHPAALIQLFNQRAFPSQPLAKRIAIVLAGPLSNILFAPLLMIIVLMTGVPAMLPVLGKVQTTMPGYVAGLRPGDHIVAFDGKPIATWDQLSEAVKASGGHPVNFAVERGPDHQIVHIEVTPKRIDETTIYGNKAPMWIIGVMPSGAETTRRLGPLQAIPQAFIQTGEMCATLCVGIWKIIDGATPARKALGGPIMIAQIAGREARQGFADVALFTVMLSIELGVINLLPVPLLDGGHLAFFIIEGLRGKPLQLRHREIAMQVGLFLLVMLMAFVILNDISRIVG
ncbi:MAG: RIP metalloprotease RseP [Candidatus Binataceae bacterium]